MIGLPLLLAGLVAGQGQALEIIYPTEAGLTDVAVQWSGHSVPFVQSGDHWVTTVGVDLDSRAGTHAVDVTFRYADGHTRVERQPVEVRPEKYPTTELTVEDRYVALSPEDQARANREGEETNAIYAKITPERYWTARFEVPGERPKDDRRFGHRR